MFARVEAGGNNRLPVLLVVRHFGLVSPQSGDKGNMWANGGVFPRCEGLNLVDDFDEIWHQCVVFFEQHEGFDMREVEGREIEFPPPVMFDVH